MDLYALTEQGKGRVVNQDRYAYNKFEEDDEKVTGIFVVADGVGGRSCGGEAANMSAEMIMDWWYDHYPEYYNNPEQLQEVLPDVFNNIVGSLFDFGDEQNVKLATTMTMLIINHDEYYIFHCGDTRIYRYNEGLACLTLDDKAIDPRDGKAKLTNCLGNILPEYHLSFDKGQLYDEDVFLLATDGAFKKVDEKQIETIMGKPETAEEICNEIYEAAINAGEQDDITMICFKLKNPE